MNFFTNIDVTFYHSFIRILVSVNTSSSDSTISSTGKPTEICKSSSDEKSLTITVESKITPVWILKFTFFSNFYFLVEILNFSMKQLGQHFRGDYFGGLILDLFSVISGKCRV